jgi:hypothetical protein
MACPKGAYHGWYAITWQFDSTDLNRESDSMRQIEVERIVVAGGRQICQDTNLDGAAARRVSHMDVANQSNGAVRFNGLEYKAGLNEQD